MAEVQSITASINNTLTLIWNQQIQTPHQIYIYTDSQAAIMALSAPSINSKTVLTCHETLNTATSFANIHLQWIKAHMGNPGNELADSLAKTGATTPLPEVGPGPFGPIPHSFLKRFLRIHLMDAWEESWIHREPCRQTKIWFPSPDLAKSQLIMTHDRITLGKLIRWLTGHNFLRRHQHLINPDTYESAKCRLCYTSDETAAHLLLECPILNSTRNHFLHHRRPQPPIKWDVPSLKNFIDYIADTMEDQSNQPPDLEVRNDNKTTTLISLDPVEYHYFSTSSSP